MLQLSRPSLIHRRTIAEQPVSKPSVRKTIAAGTIAAKRDSIVRRVSIMPTSIDENEGKSQQTHCLELHQIQM